MCFKICLLIIDISVVSVNVKHDICNKRNERIDSIKFFLMLLVIAGHVLSQIDTLWPSDYSRVAWQWIYIFHMPLFIVLSGYFSHKKSIKGFFSSTLRLLEPLLLFQIAYIIINQAFSISDILTPWWILWYLLSLIFWRIMLQFIPQRILEREKTVVYVTFAIGIVAGFLPLTKILSLQRTFAFLPFFFLGYYARKKNLINKYLEHKSHSILFFSILFLVSTIIIPYLSPRFLGDLRQSMPYHSIYSMFCRLFVYCLSIPMAISFIIVCPHNNTFAKQGRYTMQYYLLHSLFVICLIQLLQAINQPLATSFVAALLYTFLIVAIIWGLSYLPFFDKITNPLLFFLEKRKTL